MRILLYNFIQPEEPGSGGVGVYMNNLAKALIGSGHDVITMSSGDLYSLLRQQPRIEFAHQGHDRAVLWNSPVVSPAYFTFGDPQSYTDSSDLDFAPALLRERYADIDVFHFQNIEGLTSSFFHKLRSAFPGARLIFSVHNYHTMCSRVTLWFQNRTVCEDYRDGVACTMCGVRTFDLHIVRRERRLLGARSRHPRLALLASPCFKVARLGWRLLQRARAWKAERKEAAVPNSMPANAAAYAKLREGNINLFRDVFDRVLAVSARTRQVMIERGAPAEKIAVSYIGTAHKEAFLTSTKITDVGAALHLGYIGYMTRDKGFHFLLDCLERLPKDVAARMTVTIAARNTDPDARARVEMLGSRYDAVRYFDGYTHDNLGTVLQGVNLGLIPVLWEDNLPQTAIEMVSRGIPIVTSDRGGAQEIAQNARFTFPAGDHAALIERIEQIGNGDIALSEFWASEMRIFSMEEHVADLMQYYRPSVSRQPILPHVGRD
jgi:glycosyltransferase involved in cell wall biosynthesis